MYILNMEVLKYLMLLLGSLGGVIALYFTLATYGIIRENLIESMPVCHVHGTRKRIVDTFYGRVFYLPNSLYGIVYYLLILGYTHVCWGAKIPAIDTGLVVMNTGVTAFSGFLYWALRTRLHTICRLCITSHIINALIFLLAGWKYLQWYLTGS